LVDIGSAFLLFLTLVDWIRVNELREMRSLGMRKHRVWGNT